MTNDFVIRLACQWWTQDGRRTKERFAEIVRHYAGTYALTFTDEEIDAAWERIPAWQKE